MPDPNASPFAKQNYDDWKEARKPLSDYPESVPTDPSVMDTKINDLKSLMAQTPFPSPSEGMQELIERVDALERLIKVTFNGHVLINGQFVQIIT